MNILGIAKTQAKFAAIKLRVEAASPFAVTQGGEQIANRMRSIAPRRTGRLASNIAVDVEGLGEGAVAKVGSNVEYDRFVQKGTVYMTAQPYGEDASNEATAAVVAAITAVYKAALP